MNLSTLNAWAPRMLSVLRIMTGLLFLAHGTQKLLGFPAGANPPPAVLSLSWTAGALELVGGVLIVIGLFTRPVAFILSGQMAAAYFLAHAPRSFFPVNNAGDAAILYCFVFLYLVFAGRVRGASTPAAPADTETATDPVHPKKALFAGEG